MARAPRSACALVAACALLAGCAAPPGAAPIGPLSLSDDALWAAGASLPLSHWAAEGPPRAVILGLHGYGDYAASTFAEAGPAWAARGIEVYAYDQRGFGHNADRGQWPGPDALIDDLAEVARAVAARHPGLPLFVVGHSMGGGVALAAAGEGRLPEASGLVLLAPAVWGGATLPLPYRASAWIVEQLVPDKRWTGDGVVEIQASDNIPMLLALGADPLVIHAPASRDFMGLIRLMDRAVAAAPHDPLPTLMVYGAHDEVVPEEPVRAAYAALPSPKRFDFVPGGWHMLLRDLDAARVHAGVADWVLSGAGGS
ncbi:alpha/beta fold hydrolase [Paroceanicella profunda]|uniref:alpha/beta fold hydrolase n=1 Tax=Paroceanicella profunda TaxID=2579971 RepID=UPI0014789EB9|nr:alpha/beta fold hydrolase [Paroceanicella profunda]